MGDTQWSYNRELAQMASIDGIPSNVERLYNDVTDRRKLHLTSYKQDFFEKKGDAYVRCENKK
jgi:hypothetical protein